MVHLLVACIPSKTVDEKVLEYVGLNSLIAPYGTGCVI